MGAWSSRWATAAIVEFASVVEAVDCAATLQQAVRGSISAIAPRATPLVYRIGINLGDVVVEGEDLLGDASSLPPGWSSSASRAAC